MPGKTKTRKHAARDGKGRHYVETETAHNTTSATSTTSGGSSGKRKKDKGKQKQQQKDKRRSDRRRDAKKDKDHTPMKLSIKKTIANRFRRNKSGNGDTNKPQSSSMTGNSSVASSSMASELDESSAFQSPRVFVQSNGTIAVNVNVKPNTNTNTKTRTKSSPSPSPSPPAIETKQIEPRGLSPVRKNMSPRKSKSKEKDEMMSVQQQTPKEQHPWNQQRPSKEQVRNKQPLSKKKAQKPQQRRSRTTIEGEPDRSGKKHGRKHDSERKVNTKYPEGFQSFSDSSDYTDTDFDGEYGSDEASSVYSDPGYDPLSFRLETGTCSDSDSDSDETGSDSDSDFSGSSASYTTEGGSKGVTMRTERSVMNRNPGAERARSSRQRIKKSRIATTTSTAPRASSSSNHISSPRKSPRKKETISSPTRRRDSVTTRGESYSDDSSYATGTSYDSSDSDSDDSNSNTYGSSYDDSESEGGSETSYEEDTRHLRDATFSGSYYDEDTGHLRAATSSGSWTERPISTYGSEETERTNLTNQKPQELYPALIADLGSQSTEDTSRYQLDSLESRSTMCDSRDLGSIDEREYDLFVEEQEAAEKAEIERAAALMEKQKKELEEIQKQKEQASSGGGGGVFSWIFGSSAVVVGRESTPETEVQEIEVEEGEVHAEETIIDDNRANEPTSPVSSPPPHSPRSPRSQRSMQSPRSPRSPTSPRMPTSLRSPRSPASSTNDFFVRQRRSAIFFDDDATKRPNETDPTMSPGCSVNLIEMLDVGDSMPESYGGLKEGEFLLSNHESGFSNKEEVSGEELSLSMKGSAALSNEEDNTSHSSKPVAPEDISFEQQLPTVMSSPTVSGRGQLFLTTDESSGEPSLLFCCCSPDNSMREDRLPSSGMVEKQFNLMVAAKNETSVCNSDDDVVSVFANEGSDVDDDSSCASTINTEGSQNTKEEPQSVGGAVDEVTNIQYVMNPVKIEDHQGGDDEEEISCAEKVEIQLGSQTCDDHSSSYDDSKVEQEEGQESTKRITAECLENYDISEIVHGRRSFKSKTDEDGVPIPISPPLTPAGKRERRKNALKAHRDLLYKSHSIDTNAEASKDDADDTGESTGVSDPDRAINGEEGTNKSPGESKINSDSDNSNSVLSNSIVQEEDVLSNDGEKPDALIDLVRNAFNVMMSPNHDDAPDSGVPVDNRSNVATATDVQDKVESQTPPSGPIDDMLEVAFRFFSPVETTPLIAETQLGENETLTCTNFDPNPGVRPAAAGPEKLEVESSDATTVEEEHDDSAAFAESKETPSTEGSSPSMDDTTPSDEAVLKDSRSNTSSHNKPDIVTDDSRFNCDGIPLELRPKKIWRAFDSFSVSPSVNPSVMTVETGKNDSPESKPDKNQVKESLAEVTIEEEIEQKEVVSNEQHYYTTNEKLDSIYSIGDGEEFDQNNDEEERSDDAPEQQQQQQQQPIKTTFGDPNSEPEPVLHIDTEPESDMKETKEESNLRLSTSKRYRRRTEMKRKKQLRLYQEKSPKESDLEENRLHLLSSRRSPCKEQCESFEKDQMRTTIISPTIRRLGISEIERKQDNSGSSSRSSPMKQRSESPSKTVVVEEERRDARVIDEQEEICVDRAPPSPITTPPEATTNTFKVPTNKNDGAPKNNLSDIRARIKQRRRSKFRKQQQQYDAITTPPPEPAVVADETTRKQTANVVSSENSQNDVRETSDPRDDSSSRGGYNTEEFFDAVNAFDNDRDEETTTEIEVAPPSVKIYLAPLNDQDQIYPALSYKESLLSAALSLD